MSWVAGNFTCMHGYFTHLFWYKFIKDFVMCSKCDHNHSKSEVATVTAPNWDSQNTKSLRNLKFRMCVSDRSRKEREREKKRECCYYWNCLITRSNKFMWRQMFNCQMKNAHGKSLFPKTAASSKGKKRETNLGPEHFSTRR